MSISEFAAGTVKRYSVPTIFDRVDYGKYAQLGSSRLLLHPMVHDVNQRRHVGFDPEHPRIRGGRRDAKTWKIGLCGLSWHDDNAV